MSLARAPLPAARRVARAVDVPPLLMATANAAASCCRACSTAVVAASSLASLVLTRDDEVRPSEGVPWTSERTRR